MPPFSPAGARSGSELTAQQTLAACAAALLAILLGVAPSAAGRTPHATAQAAGTAQQEAEFDPLKAEKNLEVGKYYLRRGNYDAAIDRLKDSIRYKSNYAEPHRLLGEAYEKKGEREEAVRYYKKYLEILPAAEDAGKVTKRITKLEEQIEQRKRKKHAG
ncbi:MAG: tetratricopeptide repeat protein [Candidatus Acidiferrales bacterium]